MTTGQILWGLNSFLLVVCFFFVKQGLMDLHKNIEKLDVLLGTKLDIITCQERYDIMKKNDEILFKHKHAPMRQDGSGGEVIVP